MAHCPTITQQFDPLVMILTRVLHISSRLSQTVPTRFVRQVTRAPSPSSSTPSNESSCNFAANTRADKAKPQKQRQRMQSHSYNVERNEGLQKPKTRPVCFLAVNHI
eukprot:1745460-Amphidinium_carterae.1